MQNSNHRAFHQPYMHVVLAFVLFIALQCYFASIFHVLTRFRAAMYYVVDFSDEE